MRRRGFSVLVFVFVGLAAAAGAWMGARKVPPLAAPTGAVFALDAKPAVLASGFQFAEGPAEDAQGALYWSDIRANRIHRKAPGGKVETLREDSGGANGLAFDAEGRLLACEGDRGRVTVTERDGTVRVLADTFEGKRFNKPNDLWVDDAGGIYFTDPAYGLPVVQEGEHVYRIPPKGGPAARVATLLARPNGVAASPDGTTLYVADAGRGELMAYGIGPGGALTTARLVARVKGDGVKVDVEGRIYVAADAIRVFEPGGREVDMVPLPEAPTNLRFTGADGKTLVITTPSTVYAVPARVPGADSRLRIRLSTSPSSERR